MHLLNVNKAMDKNRQMSSRSSNSQSVLIHNFEGKNVEAASHIDIDEDIQFEMESDLSIDAADIMAAISPR